MVLVPWLRLTLRSSHPPAEVVQRLAAVVDPRPWQAPLRGRIEGRRFRGTHLLPGTKRIETVASGEVASTPAGSAIRLTLRANAFGLVLAGAAPAALLGGLLSPLLGEEPPSVKDAMILLAVTAALYLTVVALFRHDAAKVRTLLADAAGANVERAATAR
jgi:hypothetical protein